MQVNLVWPRPIEWNVLETKKGEKQRAIEMGTCKFRTDRIPMNSAESSNFFFVLENTVSLSLDISLSVPRPFVSSKSIRVTDFSAEIGNKQ